MKKILLSVIALFAAVSMNAQTAVTDDPSYFNLDKSSGWGGHWFDLGGDDNKMNFDASAYEYAWIKFSGNTGKFRFGLTYSEWKSTEAWGETYYDAMNVIEEPEGYSYIQLEKEKTYEFDVNKADNPYKGDTWDKHLRQIWTQDDGTEVSVTIEGIWFGTGEQLEAILNGGEPGTDPTPAPAGDYTVAVFNVDNAMGLDAENGSAQTAGTELYNDEIGVMTIGADDTYKPQEVDFNVGGTDMKGGLQGGSNPKDADGGVPATTLKAPASGAFFQWEAKKDGFLYIIHKASSNKAYTVFEEGTAIGYTFAAAGDAASKLGATYQFTLKGEGEINEIKTPIEFAEQEYLKVADPDFYASNWEDKTADDGTVSKAWIPLKVNGLGVIVFPVLKDLKYIFNANGSKLTLGGIAFSEADDVTVKTTDGTTIYAGGGATAIQGAKVVTVAADGAIYNLAGQKVSASYKGIVIKDGKKYIQK